MRKFACLIACLWAACSPSPKSTDVEERISKVESSLVNPVYIEGDSTWSLEARMKHYGVPGVSIAVINDYKIDWVKSYGIMDKETGNPVTGKTLFQAGSISKPVAAYAALSLTEKGKFNLDENVNLYLKSWQLPDNEFTSEKKVALKHLLNHSAGTTVHGFLGYSPDLPVPTLLQVLDGNPPANSPAIRVDKTPEKDFRYSGGGYCIMQQMLIDTEGKPFPQILKEEVLVPLSMSNSTYEQPLTGEQLQAAATGYLPDGTQTKGKRHTYPEMAAAGLWTTAEDLAKFAINIQLQLKDESGKVLSKTMTEKMLTPFVSDFVGLGMFIDKRKDQVYFGHGGWDEGFSSEMVAHKNNGYGVVVLTNSNHPDFISEVIRAVARSYNWNNYVPTYKKLELDQSKVSEIIGRYRNGSDGLIIISSNDNKLFMKYIRGDKPMELIRISDSTYVKRDNDAQVQFKRNPKDGQLNILFGSESEFSRPRRKEDDKIPYEYLLAGDFDKSVNGYRALIKADPNDGAVREDNLNRQGYDLLRSGKTALAKDIFKINTILYPKSANAYDSYAEACRKNGDIDLAIANYRKSLDLNPKNEGAKAAVAEMIKN
jgi:CubicO group peptidase (beta-lactamase class C family)